MQQKVKPTLWWAVLAGCILAWSGIAIQLYDTLETRQSSVPDALIKFFSYFTILTNLLVAMHYSVIVFASDSAISRFFSKHGSASAIAVYILVVGIIYNISLRSIWTFTGWGRISNELLHTVTPVYFLLYWLLIREKEKISFRVVVYWMIFPLCYLIYSLIRGTIVDSYPYPFMDANKLGYSSVIVNCLIVAALFFILFAVFIAINNRLKRSL